MANEHSSGSCSKHNTKVRVMVFNQWLTTIDALFRLWNRNYPFNERSRRKQTARSNDRKRVSVYDLNNLADVQGSVLAIVVWSGCFPETNKVIQKDPFRHTKFYSTHQTVLTSRQWRYSGADLGGGCPPPPRDDLRFSSTTAILREKKRGLLVLK